MSDKDTLTFEKLQELRVRIDSMDSKPSIIALCEVKPKNFRYERDLAEYNLEGYDLLPYNIGKDDSGRGMLIYILSGVQYSPVNINNNFCEYLSVEIALNSSDKLLHTCDISPFRRELPIFCQFVGKSPYLIFTITLYNLYISLFGISDLPTKI